MSRRPCHGRSGRCPTSTRPRSLGFVERQTELRRGRRRRPSGVGPARRPGQAAGRRCRPRSASAWRASGADLARHPRRGPARPPPDSRGHPGCPGRPPTATASPIPSIDRGELDRDRRPRRHPGHPHRGRDAGELPRLRDERDRGARPARRPRRPQARPPPDPLHDGRDGPRRPRARTASARRSSAR